MNNENEYTPREIELLDEFAKAALQGLTNSMERMKVLGDDDIARASYESAAAMVAERRKRVPRSEGDLDDLVNGALRCFLCKGVLAPQHYIINRPQQGGLRHFDCTNPEARQDANLPAPVAQPETKPEKGELTEEAVRLWERCARHDEALDHGYCLDEAEIDRAVALMREGLAAKRERDEARAIVAMHEQCISDYKLMARNAHCSAYYAEKMREMAPGMFAEMDSLRARAERAEKAEAAFRSLLNEMSDADKGMGTWSMLWRLKTSEVFAAHPAPKAEGGAS